MNDPFLLFDLDGTISDPFDGITRSINFALSSCGYEEIPASDLAQYIGPPLEESFRSITGTDDDIETDRLISKFRERYSEVGFSENELYPGIEETISRLSDQHVPLAVCTSKREDFAEKILKRFGIRHHFRFVSGGDVGIRKWQQIETLIADGSIDHNCIMIGDRDVDLSAAHKNGIKSVGVLWGYGSRTELEMHAPIRLLAEPADLLELIG